MASFRGAVAPGVIGFVLAFVLVGCQSLATYSTTTPATLNMTDEELRAVQFYLSAPFTLIVEETRTSSQILDDNAVLNDREQYRHNLVFKRGTPVVAVEVRRTHVQVQAAPDITLTFRPDSLLGTSLPALIAQRDTLAQAIADGSLPLSADTLTAHIDSLLTVEVPFLLTEFNGQPLAHDSTVVYAERTYTVKFGYYDRARSFVERNPPRLNFERVLVETSTNDLETVPGMTVGTVSSDARSTGSDR